MGSKLIFLGILLAMVLLISSEVAAARELAEETTNAVDPSAENDAKYQGGGYGGYPGGGYGNGRGGNGGYGGGGGRGGNGGYGGGGGRGGNGGYGGGGGHGGNGGYGGGGGHGGNGGYGGGRGGYCRYGCCGRSYNRGGCRCCSFAGEKPDAQTQN